MTRRLLALFAFSIFSSTAVVGQFVAPAPGPQSEPTTDPTTEVEPLAEPTKEALQQLVGGLASESFEIRERAHAALDKYAAQFPEVLRESLSKDYIDSVDPEVRYRLAEVIYDAVVEDMEHSGFLGIIMLSSSVQVDGKVLASIQVNKVLLNSAASRAGLRSGDQIIQVDEMTFDAAPIKRPQQFRARADAPNLLKFKDYIGGKKHGAKVHLKIQRVVNRQLRIIEVDVRLGRRTRELMDPEEKRAEDLFFDQWMESRKNRK